MSSNKKIIDRIAEISTLELFAAYDMELTTKRQPEVEPASEVMYVGVVGFSGDKLRGTLMLAPSLIAMAGMTVTTTEALRDWVAELANQLVGRIKNKLLLFGVEVYVTMPLTIRGQYLAPLPRVESQPYAFDAAPGQVTVWLDIDMSADLVLEQSDTILPAEGDTILF